MASGHVESGAWFFLPVTRTLPSQAFIRLRLVLVTPLADKAVDVGSAAAILIAARTDTVRESLHDLLTYSWSKQAASQNARNADITLRNDGLLARLIAVARDGIADSRFFVAQREEFRDSRQLDSPMTFWRLGRTRTASA